MSNNNLYKSWYPEKYDKYETQTYDFELFIELFKGQKLKIFEVCCGTGRILLPLANEGHKMHGIDMDNYMLARLFEKAEDASNIHIIQGNAIITDWGKEYDAVLMAGNIVINIEKSDDYNSAQLEFIKKSYDALKVGGYFIMDNDCHKNPEEFFTNRSEPIVRDLGTNSKGVSASITYVWASYDKQKQISTNYNEVELKFPDGTTHVEKMTKIKYIPTREQMTEWVEDAGFIILNEWGDHYKNPVTDTTDRLVILARK